MKVKTIEEIHKILAKKVMDTMKERDEFHDKMTEKYGSIWWKSDATIEEKMNMIDCLMNGINIPLC